MDAVDRINEVWDRLVSLGHEQVWLRPFAEQVVFVVYCARCEKDINAFESIFQQLFGPQELKVLIEGLYRIDEVQLADDFKLAFDLLDQDGFYRHRNWDLVSRDLEARIVEIGNRVGSQLWGLDEKLVALVDGQE